MMFLTISTQFVGLCRCNQTILSLSLYRVVVADPFWSWISISIRAVISLINFYYVVDQSSISSLLPGVDVSRVDMAVAFVVVVVVDVVDDKEGTLFVGSKED